MLNVTFCVYRNDLEPSQVSARLDLEPSESWKRGEPITTKRRQYGDHPTGGWLLRSRDNVPSGELDDHLSWMLDHLLPKADPIHALAKDGFDVAIVIALEGAPLGGGPTLTAATLAKLGQLGIEVDFDIYA